MRGRGFTLIELIVGTSVMAGIVGTAYLCLSAGLTAQDSLDRRRDMGQHARIAFNALAADLGAACRLSPDYELVGMDRTIDGIEADNIDFGSYHWTPRRPGESDFCEMSYYVNRNPATGRLGLWRRRDPTPDPEPFDGGMQEELVPAIAGFRLEYYDGFSWYDTWGSNKPGGAAAASAGDEEYATLFGLPEAIRITLAFEAPREPPREASGAREANDSNDSREEPPLVVQTVVRLNLAEKLARTFGEGGSRETGGAAEGAGEAGGGGEGEAEGEGGEE